MIGKNHKKLIQIIKVNIFISLSFTSHALRRRRFTWRPWQGIK